MFQSFDRFDATNGYGIRPDEPTQASVIQNDRFQFYRFWFEHKFIKMSNWEGCCFFFSDSWIKCQKNYWISLRCSQIKSNRMTFWGTRQWPVKYFPAIETQTIGSLSPKFYLRYEEKQPFDSHCYPKTRVQIDQLRRSNNNTQFLFHRQSYDDE